MAHTLNNKSYIVSNTPILTIAIPTYNRHDKLLKQLNVLIKNISKSITIVVRDNCSEPSVCQYLMEHSFDISCIEIIENSVNIGADANIVRCFEECKTEWLWVLSDDDLIVENAIIEVLRLIEMYPNSIYLNFSNSNKSNIVQIRSFDELLLQLKDSLLYVNSFWISSCLYNMKMLKNNLIFYYNALSSMQGQLILLLKYFECNNQGEVFFLKKEIFDSCEEETSWKSLKFIDCTLNIDRYFKFENRSIVRNTLVKSQYSVMLYLLTRDFRKKLINYKMYYMYLFKLIVYKRPFSVMNLRLLINLFLPLFVRIRFVRLK